VRGGVWPHRRGGGRLRVGASEERVDGGERGRRDFW
jgi:hypothetical protein